VVNTNEIDIVNNPLDFEELMKRIAEHSGGTVYYAPRREGGEE